MPRSVASLPLILVLSGLGTVSFLAGLRAMGRDRHDALACAACGVFFTLYAAAIFLMEFFGEVQP